MRTTLVYDLPTRLFHWLFSGLFLLSFVIAKTVDDESLTFSYHMLSGLLLGSLVVWRIFWGFLGSQHARFTGFNLNPFDLKDYLFGIISGSKKRWSGHNPASSWASITMFTLALGLATTGYLMSTGNKEDFEDIHEILANTFIVIVVLHVAGVILHSLRHKDAIALSMVDGRKEQIESADSISSSRRLSAVILLALFVSAGIFLLKNFDSQTRTLTIFGKPLQLGENEDNEKENGESEENETKTDQNVAPSDQQNKGEDDDD